MRRDGRRRGRWRGSVGSRIPVGRVKVGGGGTARDGAWYLGADRLDSTRVRALSQADDGPENGTLAVSLNTAGQNSNSNQVETTTGMLLPQPPQPPLQLLPKQISCRRMTTCCFRSQVVSMVRRRATTRKG